MECSAWAYGNAAAHLAAMGHERAAIGYDVNEDLSIVSGPVG